MRLQLRESESVRDLIAYLRNRGYLAVPHGHRELEVNPLNPINERYDRAKTEETLEQWRELNPEKKPMHDSNTRAHSTARPREAGSGSRDIRPNQALAADKLALTRERRRWRWATLTSLGERTTMLQLGSADKTPVLTLAWSGWRLAIDFPRRHQQRRR